MRKHDIFLWILFAILVLCRCAETIYDNGWLVLAFISCVIAVVLLVKNKLPSKKYIVTSAVMAIVAIVGYLVYDNDGVIILLAGGLIAGIPTLLTSLAVFSVMEKTKAYSLLADKKWYSVLLSIVIGVVVGSLFSFVNTFVYTDMKYVWISTWPAPAIYEVMAFRSVFMAYCVYFSHGEKMKGFSLFTMYFMMIVPHTVAYGYDLKVTVVADVIFGLILAVLHRKRDMASAIITRGVMDIFMLIDMDIFMLIDGM